MDMQNTMAPAEPMAAPAAPVNPSPVTPVTSGMNYASFPIRFLALLIDVILIGVVKAVIAGVMGGTEAPVMVTTLLDVAGIAYLVIMTSKYGATVGKMIMKLKVQNVNTGANLNLVEAVLREFVGRILSGLPLALGYFWMLWDPKKQTWHDKLAKSVVVKQG